MYIIQLSRFSLAEQVVVLYRTSTPNDELLGEDERFTTTTTRRYCYHLASRTQPSSPHTTMPHRWHALKTAGIATQSPLVTVSLPSPVASAASLPSSNLPMTDLCIWDTILQYSGVAIHGDSGVAVHGDSGVAIHGDSGVDKQARNTIAIW